MKEKIIIKVPPKNQKPKHSLYGGALGYKCPICKGTGMSSKPTPLYGGNGCEYCGCSGRIRNKNEWIYIKAQQIAKQYEKKIGGMAQYIRL